MLDVDEVNPLELLERLRKCLLVSDLAQLEQSSRDSSHPADRGWALNHVLISAKKAMLNRSKPVGIFFQEVLVRSERDTPSLVSPSPTDWSEAWGA